MKFTFLGTSSGVPTRSRNVSGLALKVESGGGWYLVDCGEGTQHRLLETPFSLAKLQAIFITHVHGDHCYGLPGLLASAAMAGRVDPLALVAPSEVHEMIEHIARLSQTGFPFDLKMVDSSTIEQWKDQHVEVTPVALSHRVPSHGFAFNEARVETRVDQERLLAAGLPAGPEWGRLQAGQDVRLDDGRLLRSKDFVFPARKARCVIVGGDNDQPELLADCSDQADVLIHEATYTEPVAAQVSFNAMHSTAGRVASFAQKHGIPNLVLTHFSPRFQVTPRGQGALPLSDIADEARAHYKGNLILADDLDSYYLDRGCNLERVS